MRCSDIPTNPVPSHYPSKLQQIVDFFEGLSEEDKRENLIVYSDSARRCEPKADETFDLEDIRKDEECTDTVGVFLRVDPEGKAHFRLTLGPQVQTLTKAMTAILCKGLEDTTPQEVLAVPSDFVPRIVGGELVRVRSQTTYYILSRMKGICKVWLDRQRLKSVDQ
ncbi:MAG: SufE family protein [Verrucomicrobiae bacterium]|nr:SufE family protein [Verrucomicrobiae bacterium]